VPVAAVGGDVTIKPLIGERMTVKIPPHSNAGRVLRLRGLGLPVRGKTREKGDLLLEIELMFPEPFSEVDDRLYLELAKEHEDRGGEVYAPR
jgi:DnaJ-class molecular chaperone